MKVLYKVSASVLIVRRVTQSRVYDCTRINAWQVKLCQWQNYFNCNLQIGVDIVVAKTEKLSGPNLHVSFLKLCKHDINSNYTNCCCC